MHAFSSFLVCLVLFSLILFPSIILFSVLVYIKPMGAIVFNRFKNLIFSCKTLQCFSNAEEILSRLIPKQMIKGMVLRGMKDCLCNCTANNRLDDGKCLYKGNFRTTCLIYEVKCKTCKKICMQNMHKKYSKLYQD